MKASVFHQGAFHASAYCFICCFFVKNIIGYIIKILIVVFKKHFIVLRDRIQRNGCNFFLSKCYNKKNKKHPIFCTKKGSAPFGTLHVQCSKRSTNLGISINPTNSCVRRSTPGAVFQKEHCTRHPECSSNHFFAFFFADISYTDVQCASQRSKNTPTPRPTAKKTLYSVKKQKKISHNSAAASRQCQQRSGAKPIKPPSPG